MKSLLFAILLVTTAVTGAAQDTFQQSLQSATAALDAGDTTAYREHAARAAELAPPDHINRPWVQYHAARANAMLGDEVEAARYMRLMWNEGIESLMFTFAEHDPAFDRVRDRSAITAVLNLPDGLELQVTPLSDNLYRLDGAGSAIVASVGTDGVLLVDAGYRAAERSIRTALAQLDRASVDYLVVTHAHEDHMGGTIPFGAEAVVVAHPEALAQMRQPLTIMPGLDIPPKPSASLPEILVNGRTDIRFNGMTLQVHSFPAHSGGDLVVWFPEARVLHMGDNYFAVNDFINPGPNPLGFIERFGALLADLPADSRIVAGHDATQPVAALRTKFASTAAAVRFVAGHVESGLSADSIAALARSEDMNEAWIRYFYRTLAQN